MERFDLATSAGERIRMQLDEPAARSGRIILYLHGFGSRQDGEKGAFFRAAAAAAGIPFCSFDFRGHGASDGSLREITLTRNLEDVATARRFLAGRGYRSVALFGSSMGGAAALWHAATAPGTVRSVIAIAPALDTLERLEAELGPDGMARWRRQGARPLRTELVDAEVAWGLVEDLRHYARVELARRLRTRALLFHGRRDATIDWRVSADLAERARPGLVRLRLFEDGDHRLVDRLDRIWREAVEEIGRALADVAPRR